MNDISEAQVERDLVAVKRELHAAMKTIEKLLKDLQKKNEEIAHLRTLLTQTIPAVQAPKEDKKVQLEITAEEEIAVLQLQRLRQTAQQRVLTLEETRMYDLLVKNKRLSQEESTINLSKSEYRDVHDAELLQIVGKASLDEESDNG